MPDTDVIRWFKSTWGAETAAAVAGTPFDADQVIAIACQETGEIWPTLRRTGLAAAQVAALCVGDTIDYKGPNKGRQVFPRNKAELIAQPRGAEMFAIARAALESMAQYIGGYDGAVANADKFCHGFGVFQRDLQFFVDDPDYFLNRNYELYALTLAHCLKELARGAHKLGLDGAGPLTDADFCKVAIAYNTGGYKASKGLKQGFFDGEKYYGERIAEYLVKVRSVPTSSAQPTLSLPGRYVVIARSGLKLRSGPGTDYDWDRILPVGTVLNATRADVTNLAWVVVDLDGDGLIDGFVHSGFLGAADALNHETVAEPG